MEDFLNAALSTERILSVVLLLIVVGLGRWFMRQGWPDIVALVRERNEVRRAEVAAQRDAEVERARLEAEGNRLVADRLESLGRRFEHWLAETRASIAIQQTHTNLLIHILERMNGEAVVTDVLTEENFGGGG